MMSGDRHRHIDRFNRLVTIGHFKGHRLEVAVCICKLISGQAHICGTDIRAGCFNRTAEGEISFHVIQIRAGFGSVAAHAVYSTIVVSSIIRTSNRYDYINRVDRLVTIFNYEGHILKVAVRICELIAFQTHVSGSCICAERQGASAEDEISFHVIQIRAGFSSVAAHVVCSTIVVSSIVCTGNRYGYIDRVDRLVTIFNYEGHILKVAVRICELIGFQTHVSGSCICAGRQGASAEGEVCFRIQRVADFYLIPFYAVCSSVIILRIRMSGDGHGHIDRIDLLIAIDNDKGYLLEVFIQVGELFRCQIHIRLTGICAGSSCRAAEAEVIFRVKRAADFDFIAADAVFFTVVCSCILVPGNGHNHFIDRNNGLITVCHIEGHSSKVAVRVRELRLRQVHICGTDISAGSFCRTAEGEVILRIKRIADLNVITVHGVHLTIIC